MFNLVPVTAQDLNLEQLKGARVTIIYARPSFQSPMIEICTVLNYEFSKRGELMLLVKPDNARLFPKWRSEFDFISYVKSEVSAQLTA